MFVHGLGLDANDFRPYMAESRFHCIALTLYGFNTEEKDDPHYRPISLQSHVQLLATRCTSSSGCIRTSASRSWDSPWRGQYSFCYIRGARDQGSHGQQSLAPRPER